MREYLKDKINEFTTHSKNKNVRDLHRGVDEFEEGYQHVSRIYLIKGENSDLLADLHNIFNRWKNYLSELLNVCVVSEVRQMEI
jgi:hypothetical protein